MLWLLLLLTELEQTPTVSLLSLNPPAEHKHSRPGEPAVFLCVGDLTVLCGNKGFQSGSLVMFDIFNAPFLNFHTISVRYERPKLGINRKYTNIAYALPSILPLPLLFKELIFMMLIPRMICWDIYITQQD